MDDGASECDDTREFCEECGKAIEEGQQVYRCGSVVWHADRDRLGAPCGGPCGECAEEGRM